MSRSRTSNRLNILAATALLMTCSTHRLEDIEKPLVALDYRSGDVAPLRRLLVIDDQSELIYVNERGKSRRRTIPENERLSIQRIMESNAARTFTQCSLDIAPAFACCDRREIGMLTPSGWIVLAPASPECRPPTELVAILNRLDQEYANSKFFRGLSDLITSSTSISNT